MTRIRSHRLSCTRIDDPTAREMFRIFSRYYVDVDFESFHRDLHEKDECVLLCTPLDPGAHNPTPMLPGRLVGFTTLRRDRDPGPFGATYLFSGDTVLEKEVWGRRLLEQSFFWTMLREKLRAPWRPLYWMLISKGFVTYLMMVRNFPASHPRFDRPMPMRLRERMDRYYAGRYGEHYSPSTGLVRFERSHGAVKGRLGDPKGAMHADPDVAYFVACNPDYAHGDELACIAEIRARDFALHFATAFRRRRNRRSRTRTTTTRRPDLDAPRTV